MGSSDYCTPVLHKEAFENNENALQVFCKQQSSWVASGKKLYPDKKTKKRSTLQGLLMVAKELAWNNEEQEKLREQYDRGKKRI